MERFGVIKRQDLNKGLTKYFLEETDMFDDEAGEEVKVIMDFLDEFMWNQCMQTELKF